MKWNCLLAKIFSSESCFICSAFHSIRNTSLCASHVWYPHNHKSYWSRYKKINEKKMKLKLVMYFSLINYVVGEETIENSEVAEQLYKQLFKHKRAEQIEAIKSLRSSLNYEKQYSMIMIMTEKIFGMIQEARASIESSSFIPGVSDFPASERVRDSLSHILENTALFGEIVLRFPDIAQVVLKTNNNWDVLLQWSIAFSNQVKYLLDKSTIKLLHLVSQELNHIERDPTYINPYKKENWVQTTKEDALPTKKKKKKEIRKGPQLRNIEL